MVTDIRYNGYTATPSDNECPDGDLADAMGIVPESTSLKATLQPTVVLSYLEHDVVFIHKVEPMNTHICKDESNNLYWVTDDAQNATLIHAFGEEPIRQVTAIGNTLVVLTTERIFYALWTPADNSYADLGEKFPECPLSFGLVGEAVFYSQLTYEEGSEDNGRFELTYDRVENSYDEFTDENKTKITDQALAKVNRFISEVSVGNNRFMYPFFVRYGYRLYDDSLAYISAPILMLPTTTVAPYVMCGSTGGTTSTKADIFAIVADLDYQFTAGESAKAEIEKWGEIIKSVDIFISAPIYTYDQSGYCESFATSSDVRTEGKFLGQFVPKNPYRTSDNHIMSLAHQSWKIHELYGYEYYEEGNNTGKVGFTENMLKLPRIDPSVVDKNIIECSVFYLLTSIEIKDLSLTRTKIEIENGVLSSLTNREVMTDDYLDHDSMTATRAFGYNNRLNLSGLKRKLFKGFDFTSQITTLKGTRTRLRYRESSDGDGAFALILADHEMEDFPSKVTIYTKLQENEGEFLVKSESLTQVSVVEDDVYYAYYPSTSAKVMYFKDASNVWQQNGLERTLRPHPMLNGAVFFSGLSGGGWKASSTTIPTEIEEAVVTINNKIYTSEINNPFFFPLLGINTIGTGEVLGMSTAAKALSQGQFGQFPLYAFTTEGVWALEVSATGAYSARQPITQDVCSNPESITQLDNSVLFATDRGIMLLSGSDTACISDVLKDDDVPLSLIDLPKGRELLLQEFPSWGESAAGRVPFLTYLKDCGVIYDYTSQQVIVHNPNYWYAYVFSLESKGWGIMHNNILHGVPSYPNAYAVTKQANGVYDLVDFSKRDFNNKVKGYFVTRPIKADAKDALKTLSTIIQRGYFRKGNVKSLVWGSRDMFNWFLIASSTDHYLRGFRGTPYKYFRVGCVFNLDSKERIFGSTIQFDVKDNNQLR